MISTDIDPERADFYADQRIRLRPGSVKTLFEIRAPRSTSAADVGIGEILLDHDSQFRIVSSRRDAAGVVHVVMEHIGVKS
jgi:hypothetical protein